MLLVLSVYVFYDNRIRYWNDLILAGSQSITITIYPDFSLVKQVVLLKLSLSLWVLRCAVHHSSSGKTFGSSGLASVNKTVVSEIQHGIILGSNSPPHWYLREWKYTVP